MASMNGFQYLEEEEEECGYRKFYDLSTAFNFIEKDGASSSESVLQQDHEKAISPPNETLLDFIYNDIIGKDQDFVGPFGSRKIVYCDYVASGKPLKSIENYLYSEVLPFYGNTHTTTTVSSLQTTLFRHEARDIIRNAVNASEHDAVIFVGCGCTGAVHKLINGLKLTEPPIVFYGPYEHHSNLLPWREISSEAVRISETSEGLVDLEMLKTELKKRQGKGTLIGCFSAVSNVTGIVAQDNEITAILHEHGALAFWDYAAGAPYLRIDMNPKDPAYIQRDIKKDAVYFSMHKFVGGVQTPGILVVKKKVMKNGVPNGGGGGSVFFVTRNGHRYLKDLEMREEGGTPAIVESIRAGLTMQLKMTVTSEVIAQRERDIVSKAFKKWSSVPELQILGSTTATRLPIFSFKVCHSSGRYLHHNFVSAILNDVFGIQSRGGCACAGPYAQDLLGIDEDLADKYELVLLEDSRLDRDHLRRKEEHSGLEVLRPGFCRVGIPYFFPDELVDFVIEAVSLTAQFAWKLLPQYRLNPETGEWHHWSQLTFKNRRWLGSVQFTSSGLQVRRQKESHEEAPCAQETLRLFTEKIISASQEIHRSLPNEDLIFDTEEKKNLRWFMTPSEAVSVLDGRGCGTFTPPFRLKKYKEVKGELKGCSFHIDIGDLPTAPPSVKLKNIPVTEDNERICVLADRPKKIPVEKNKKARENWQYSNEPTRVSRAVNETYTSSDDSPLSKTSNRSNDCPRTISYEKENVVEDVFDSLDELLVVLDGNMNDVRTSEDCAQDEIIERRAPSPVKTGWVSVPKIIMKPMIDSVNQHGMIKDGDKVMVCVSGGKDSLTLLHALHQYKEHMKQRNFSFDLAAVTVDPGSSSYDPSPLIPYMKQLGIAYYYEKQGILVQALACDDGVSSICSFCSRMKRGRIYAAARRAGFNVIALGQHLDDLAESFFMSVFHNGRLRTMKASYMNREMDIRVIRPLVCLRERDIRSFAESNHLPVIAENCPACFESPKERHRVKQLLAAQEILHPQIFNSIKCALMPLMSINMPGVERQLFGKKGKAEDNFDDDVL